METLRGCRRMAVDDGLMKKYYRCFELRDAATNPHYIGWVKGRGYRNRYQLKLVLPRGYPSVQPELFVTYPRELPLKGSGQLINNLGTSHAYHVLGNGGGPVQICLTNNWDPSCTCVQAIHRGCLYVAAYEVHLITGRTIAEIIEEWKKKLKPCRPVLNPTAGCAPRREVAPLPLREPGHGVVPSPLKPPVIVEGRRPSPVNLSAAGRPTMYTMAGGMLGRRFKGLRGTLERIFGL